MNQHDSVLSEVEKLRIFKELRRVRNSQQNDGSILEGKVCIEGHEVTVRLVLESSFPLKLPKFYLCPWNALGFIPHVNQQGFVCFNDPEGLALDRRRPVQIIQEAFERMVRVLTDGVTGRNQADFVDEFEFYWAQLKDIQSASYLFDPVDETRRIFIIESHQDNTFYIADNERDLSTFNRSNIEKSHTAEKGLYLPLKPGAIVIPPHPDGPFWTASEIRQILLPNLSNSNRQKLEKLLKRKRIAKVVVVRLPRPSGGSALFGFRYDRVKDKHPLLEAETAGNVIPLKLERLNRIYLIQRGGGEIQLASKRVLLVGCGAVGGYLAFELARAGILDLTLVDEDILMPENSFRHVLGRRHWRKHKVQALKEEIEAQLPYVCVRVIVSCIENALMSHVIDLTRYDLLILATGNPTVELDINERIHTISNSPAAIFTWLEPLGIGGHALLTRNISSGGCFECLYTSANGEMTENRASFAASGQFFGRSLSGCSNLHTPYGSMDANCTAVLAARLAVNVLTGTEYGNPLLSWKGDARAFVEEGFLLSNRYNALDTEIFHHRYSYRNDRCRVCGTWEII